MSETVDVIVIGGGFAGLSAAIEAKLKGKQVIVFEKMAKIGGNSVISDGGIAAPNTQLQKKYGINDSVALMKKDILNAGKHKNNPELVDILVNNAKDGFLWTKDFLGVDYLDRVDIFGGHSVPRCYTPKNITGRDLIKALEKKCKALEIEIRTKTLVKDFIVKDNIFEGVEIVKDYHYSKQEGKESSKIYAQNGIVLASGGYGQNKTLIGRFKEEFLELDSTNKPSADNHLLEKLLDYQVKMVDLDQIQLLPSTSIDEKGFGAGSLFGDYIVFPYGVLINPMSMKRFTNELIDRGRLSEAIMNVGDYAIGLADQTAVEIAGWDISKAIKKGIVKKYDSLEQLAKAFNRSGKSLKDSIKRYNIFIENGTDQDFNKPLTNQKKIIAPPFYVMRMRPKIHHTMGGLAINKHGQVLNEDNQPVQKLYAAGETTGGIHGAARLGSMAVTDCVVFGRIVGRHIN
ncbi:MAG: flavocytochrome c [Candidatus Izimaplasma sp.]|nr:flavocytochrome c [Candidatus Izimaplasma bacterium]